MKEMEKLLEKFFRQKWQLFNNELRLSLPSNPGVYAFAYTEKKLEGEKAKPADIFYVGMSNSKKGLKGRINSFNRGIRKGDSHSGAIRFFKNYLKRKSYYKVKSQKKLWIAHLPLDCKVIKDRRTPKDLRTMGKVACLEYFVLARVKDATGYEPDLNLK